MSRLPVPTTTKRFPLGATSNIQPLESPTYRHRSGLTPRSEAPCIPENECCTEGKGLNRGSWIQNNSWQTEDLDVLDAKTPAGTDEDASEMCAEGHSSTVQGSRFTMNADDEPSRRASSISSITSNTSSSNSAYLSPHISKIPIASHYFFTPRRTLRFSDPAPIIPEPLSSSSLPSPNPIFDAHLDSCIVRTRALLAAGEKALSAKGEADVVVEHLERTESDVRDRNEGDGVDVGFEEKRSPVSDADFAAAFEGEGGKERVLESKELVRKEVVKVEGWYKFKGGEAWRKIGGT